MKRRQFKKNNNRKLFKRMCSRFFSFVLSCLTVYVRFLYYLMSLSLVACVNVILAYYISVVCNVYPPCAKFVSESSLFELSARLVFLFLYSGVMRVVNLHGNSFEFIITFFIFFCIFALLIFKGQRGDFLKMYTVPYYFFFSSELSDRVSHARVCDVFPQCRLEFANVWRSPFRSFADFSIVLSALKSLLGRGNGYFYRLFILKFIIAPISRQSFDVVATRVDKLTQILIRDSIFMSKVRFDIILLSKYFFFLSIYCSIFLYVVTGMICYQFPTWVWCAWLSNASLFFGLLSLLISLLLFFFYLVDKIYCYYILLSKGASLYVFKTDDFITPKKTILIFTFFATRQALKNAESIRRSNSNYYRKPWQFSYFFAALLIFPIYVLSVYFWYGAL